MIKIFYIILSIKLFELKEKLWVNNVKKVSIKETPTYVPNCEEKL